MLPESIPQIPAYAERHPDGVWDLFVACPFCADRHRHGGGAGDRPGFGHRLSHCIRGDQRDDYLLVAGPIDMGKPAGQPRSWRTQQWRNDLQGKPALAPHEEADRDAA